MSNNLKAIGTLKGHKEQVTCITVPDEGNSNVFFTSSRDKQIYKWMFTGQEDIAQIMKAYSESRHYVHTIVSTQSNQIISGGADSLARIYDIDTKECLKLVGHTRDITCVTVNSADNKIVTGSIDGSICLWNSRGDMIIRYESNHHNMHKDWINCASFVPNSDRLVTGSSDGTIKLWDINNGQVLKTYYKGTTQEFKQLGAVSALSITADGNICAYGGWDSFVYIVHLEKDINVSTFRTESSVTALAFAWTEPIIAIGTKTHIYLWDVVVEETLATLKCSDFASKAFCTSLAWSKNYLLIGLNTGEIKLHAFTRGETAE